MTNHWRIFFIIWLIGAVVFGLIHVRWLRRHAALGNKVTTPIFQFVFGVLLAPLAVMIVAALIWSAT